MFYPNFEPYICHDLILQIISYQIKDYMRDHGSIGLFLGNGLILVGNLALSIFGLFLFCFCLVWGEQVTDAQDFGWKSKGEDHFRSWFRFFSCLLGDSYVLFKHCLVQRPVCIFLSLPMFDWEFSLFFLFSPALLIQSFLSSFFCFFFFCCLPRARIDILTLGQGLWQVGILAQGL